MNIINSFFKASQAFKEAWSKNSAPSPISKQIYSAPLAEKLSNIWQGYHVTQKSRVESQIKNGVFENRKLNIYWYPFLLNGGERSVFLFGGKTKGCWTAEDPVLLKIGSNNLWYRNPHGFPFFPSGENQNVKILEVYEIDPLWIKARRERKQFPNLSEKIYLSFSAGKNILIKEFSK